MKASWTVSTLKVMNFVLRCRVARKFCGTFILRIAETKLAPQMFGELIVSIAKVWFSCWGLIFVIFRRSCARNTSKATSRDVTVVKHVTLPVNIVNLEQFPVFLRRCCRQSFCTVLRYRKKHWTLKFCFVFFITRCLLADALLIHVDNRY